MEGWFKTTSISKFVIDVWSKIFMRLRPLTQNGSVSGRGSTAN